MPSVTALHLTPVKSTRLHDPEAVDLRPEGAVGDRRFLFARRDGTRLSGISKAPLMPLATDWDRNEERLRIGGLPDGTVEGDARPVGAPIEIALFDRPVKARRIDPIFDEPIRRIDETLTLLRVDEPDYAGGMHRVSIVSNATIADVGARGGDPGLDPRRFRMLVELDDLDPYEEDRWQGRKLRIGDAVVRLGERMPRCVMTTLNPDTGSKDFDTLGVLATHRKVGNALLLGVYGDVVRPGILRRGDTVEILA